MPDEIYANQRQDQVLIRLDTFIRLRWYAITGQAGAIMLIAFGFQYAIYWKICIALIIASAGLNIVLTRIYQANHRLRGRGAMALLMFDVMQLGMLLFLTGGLQNPFAILLLAPVVVAASSLHHYHILTLGALTVTVITVLAYVHLPLPWDTNAPLRIPFLYNVGVWVAMVSTLAFTVIYAYRVAVESRKLADALSATELVLQREQHLSALDGLAAAAAHELGTPLATIALVSKEMAHALKSDDGLREDALLLRSQAQRCREILQKLSSLTEQEETILDTQSLAALIEEEVAPLREFGVMIEVHSQGDKNDMPMVRRNPGIHYGLGNLLDNAVDFAKEKVVVLLIWDSTTVHVQISDDGPGFPPALIGRLGEPFVSARPRAQPGEQRGMGLGLFIAKTLLERSAATLSFSNDQKNPPHGTGAYIDVQWRRDQLV